MRQTRRANQELMQTEPVGAEAGAGENYVIPADHICWWMRSERVLTCWDKQVRLGARVGPAGLENVRKRFHDQDERFNDSN